MTIWNQIADNIVTKMVQRIYTKNRQKYVDSLKYYTESDYYWLPKKIPFLPILINLHMPMFVKTSDVCTWCNKITNITTD